MALRWRRQGRGASRRDLEVLIRERTAELELAIEQMESADTIIDRWTLDGVIHYMNDFGLKTFGFTAEEVVGNRAVGSIVPSDPDRLAEWVAVREQLEADPNRNVHSELQCRRKDGSPVWVAFRNRPILDADDNIVEVFSVGIDITDRRLREDRLEADNQRMEHELTIGRDIQLSMLPERFPAFPDREEFTVHAALEAAREVGGDFYDFFLVDDRHLCVCVGDVSDKGVPAALFMAVTKTLINSQGANDLSPAGILSHVNDELCRRNTQSMFVTIFIAVLDTQTGELHYGNAGHNPPLVRRATGELVALDDRHGPAAGVLEGFGYASNRLTLGPGDLLLMFTDGVTEAMDPGRRPFGDDRLADLLAGAGDADPRIVVDAVFAEVAAHTGPQEPFDDVTALALAFHGSRRPPAQLELTLTNRLDEIGPALDRFDRWMVDHSVADETRRAVLAVADDLLGNVVTHGIGEGAHTIEASLEIVEGRLELRVSDDGAPFNPFHEPVPDVTGSVDDREVGGLGIHLARSLMDEHEYARESGRNLVRVSHRLDDPEGGVGG